MGDATAHDVVLLGLEGFRVLGVAEDDAELVIEVETVEEAPTCPDCGGRPTGKGRRTVTVRDLPMAGRPVRLRWRKRRLMCPDAQCPRRSWSETHPEIRPRRVLWERACREACRRVGQDAATVVQVARDFGVSRVDDLVGGGRIRYPAGRRTVVGRRLAGGIRRAPLAMCLAGGEVGDGGLRSRPRSGRRRPAGPLQPQDAPRSWTPTSPTCSMRWRWCPPSP